VNLLSGVCYDVVVSVNVEARTAAPGNDDYVEEAWDLKERIRREEGVLKQRRGFFTSAYRRSTVYAYVATGDEERLIGFAVTRRDGYILFLAVAPEFRGEGYGKRLVAFVADDHKSVTCHARASNQQALDFYKHIGFEVERRATFYYEDGGDALYLRLGDGGLREKLSRLVGL